MNIRRLSLPQINVQTLQLEQDYTNEILTEILYVNAKQEVLNGRYVCDIELNIKLAALQMAIDLEPNEDLDILDIFGFVVFSSTIVLKFWKNSFIKFLVGIREKLLY